MMHRLAKSPTDNKVLRAAISGCQVKPRQSQKTLFRLTLKGLLPPALGSDRGLSFECWLRDAVWGPSIVDYTMDRPMTTHNKRNTRVQASGVTGLLLNVLLL